uniref:Uncharacterized protein n=1 Tax=Rhizophora mucronata TaxID=61149 RepID=A0A2P2N106_RHIMU
MHANIFYDNIGLWYSSFKNKILYLQYLSLKVLQHFTHTFKQFDSCSK